MSIRVAVAVKPTDAVYNRIHLPRRRQIRPLILTSHAHVVSIFSLRDFSQLFGVVVNHACVNNDVEAVAISRLRWHFGMATNPLCRAPNNAARAVPASGNGVSPAENARVMSNSFCGGLLTLVAIDGRFCTLAQAIIDALSMKAYSKARA